MKPTVLKSAMLSLFLLAGAAASHAQTVTVGPTGQYPTPCQAFPHLTNGETVQIDANGGVPYNDSTDCPVTADYLTIVGVNGRPVMDGSGMYTGKGLWHIDGHDIVIDNIEFRNARGAGNAEGMRIEIGDGADNNATDGGNVTVQHSYIHDNGTGILTGFQDQYGSGLYWYSANSYITFQYDEFAYNGDGSGSTHNMYIGYDALGTTTFTFQYSWTHDSYAGNNIKTRGPINNILYNMDTDQDGYANYLYDECLGGSDYVVGNVFQKGVVTSDPNVATPTENWFIYADDVEDVDGPEYGTNHQDLHFINNTVVDDPSNGYPSQFISMSCGSTPQSSCPAPNGGSPAESVPAVIENNIFVGPAGNAVTNQNGQSGSPTAYVENNLVQTYSASQLAADFVDWTHYDYHLAAGSPAIQAGIYPPTNNAGASDPKALAAYEFVMPTGAVSRPTPSGSTMDAGAYSYPRVGTVPNPSLQYTTTVTAPGTGTITISGLSTPPSGSYNYAAFISENTADISNPPSADSTTGTITTTFSVNPAVTQSTQVPIDIYVMGAHLVATVTVNPGPPVLSSITQDYGYQVFTTVHLEGPAPSGGTVIDLSSSNQTYLAVPSSVTVPQGQISAETGSSTGSLWGQSPSNPSETITATQGSVQKTVTFNVFNPAFHSTETEYSSITGGSPLAWCVVMVGDWPKGTNSIQVTSSNTAVIPNQSITAGYGGCNGTLQGSTTPFNDNNFDGDIAIATNSVSTATNVNVTLNLNGDTTNGNGQPNTTTITVNPGGLVPASVTVVSGSGQSANVGTPFTNPLVVVVKTSNGTVVPNATVTFSGSNVSFPNGATAVTNSSGDAQVTAEPTAAGSLTIDASVSGVGSPAVFSETGTNPSVALSSVTLDSPYGAGTTVNLTGPAPAGGAVVSLSSSNTNVLYTPASVTVPAGQTSAEDGTALGAWWGQSPTSKSATLTATYNGTTKKLTASYLAPGIHGFGCDYSPCTVVGGQSFGVVFEGTDAGAPINGGSIKVTSSNTAVIPNQSYALTVGQGGYVPFNITTKAVTATKTVTVNVTYNGAVYWSPVSVTVNP